MRNMQTTYVAVSICRVGPWQVD